MTWGEFIKARRLSLGLTLQQVGDRCGVGKSTVRKWENGMEPGRRNLLKLSEVLGLTAEQILKGA